MVPFSGFSFFLGDDILGTLGDGSSVLEMEKRSDLTFVGEGEGRGELGTDRTLVSL